MEKNPLCQQLVDPIKFVELRNVLDFSIMSLTKLTY